MTKSPLAVARTALETSRETLPAYSSKYPRHDFTQHQHFALLALREFLRTDYRGLEAMLRDWGDLRDALGLTKVSDHSTMQQAAERLLGSALRARHWANQKKEILLRVLSHNLMLLAAA